MNALIKLLIGHLILRFDFPLVLTENLNSIFQIFLLMMLVVLFYRTRFKTFFLLMLRILHGVLICRNKFRMSLSLIVGLLLGPMIILM